MAKGKSRRTLLGIQGLIGHQQASNWDYIYRVSSVIDPKWNIGDLTEMPDGRKFRYCLSVDRCDTYIANAFMNEIGTTVHDVGIDWSALAATQAIGDKQVTMTLPSTRDIAEDALRGGLITLNPSSGSNNPTIQERLIVGNTAGVASGTLVIYLDAGLVTALTSGTAYAYCMPSPYSAVKAAGLLASTDLYNASMVGYAAAPVSTSGLYHWEQTAGQISVSAYGTVGGTDNMREVVFRYDGNIIHRGSTGAPGLEGQHAGYIMDKNARNAATVIMLQLEG